MLNGGVPYFAQGFKSWEHRLVLGTWFLANVARGLIKILAIVRVVIGCRHSLVEMQRLSAHDWEIGSPGDFICSDRKGKCITGRRR